MMCQIEKNDKGTVKIRWSCPLCQESFGFYLHDVEVMDFFVVHHLMGKHEHSPDDVLAFEADLQEAVGEYVAARKADLGDGRGESLGRPSMGVRSGKGQISSVATSGRL